MTDNQLRRDERAGNPLKLVKATRKRNGLWYGYWRKSEQDTFRYVVNGHGQRIVYRTKEAALAAAEYNAETGE